uniref:Candidate secreted effector n=2 Tax=Meloidogyne incognita group TaxID=654580 RepID=A0A914L067_MELIC
MGGGRWWEMWGREENNEEESNNKVFNWNELMEDKWKIDNKWKDENYVNKEYNNNNNGFIPINGLLPRINGQYWKGFNEIEDKNEIEKIDKEKTIEVEEEKLEVEEENKKEENNNGRFSWGGIFNRNENNGEKKGNCWWKKILNGIGNVAKMFVKEETSNEENENLDNLNKFEKDNEWSKKENKEEFIKKEVIEVKTEKKEDEIIEKKDKEESVEKRKSGERKGSQW